MFKTVQLLTFFENFSLVVGEQDLQLDYLRREAIGNKAIGRVTFAMKVLMDKVEA